MPDQQNSTVTFSIESLPHGFAEFARDGSLRRVNRRLRQMLDLHGADSSWSLWNRIASNEDAERLKQALSQSGPAPALLISARVPGRAPRRLRFEWLEADGADCVRAALVTDVTEQCAREERLEELEHVERRYQAIWEHNLAIISIFDTQGRYLERNPGGDATFGGDIDSLRGRLASQIFVAAEDRDRVQAIISAAVRQGRPQQYQLETIGRDERRRVLDAVLVPLTVDGQVRELISVSRDVTERQEMLERLRRKRELLDFFFNQNLAGAFFMMLDEPIDWSGVADKEAALDRYLQTSRVTRLNPALVEQYGLTEEQMLGRSLAELLFGDPAQGRRQLRQLLDQGYLHAESLDQQVGGRSLRLEGDYVCLYDQDCRVIGHFGIQRDVTEQVSAQRRLRDSEERLRMLFDSSPDFIWITDNDGRFVKVNPAGEQLTGYSESELIGRSLLDLVPADERQAAVKWQRRHAHVRIRYFRTRIRRKNGDICQLATSSAPYFVNGERVGTAGIS